MKDESKLLNMHKNVSQLISTISFLASCYLRGNGLGTIISGLVSPLIVILLGRLFIGMCVTLAYWTAEQGRETNLYNDRAGYLVQRPASAGVAAPAANQAFSTPSGSTKATQTT